MKFSFAFLTLAAASLVAALPQPGDWKNDSNDDNNKNGGDNGWNHHGRDHHGSGSSAVTTVTATSTVIVTASASTCETPTGSSAEPLTSSSASTPEASSTAIREEAASSTGSAFGTDSASSAPASTVTTSSISSTVTASSVSSTAFSSAASPSSSPEPEPESLGAIYFITNNPQGNYVVTANIGPDGNVTYGGSVSAAGTGTHGDDGGANAPDATFSGGIVSVHQDKSLLATVNTVSNTVVLFKIDPQNPTKLTMLGGPVPSEGEFPNSVAFNKGGDRLCVLNTGAVAGIACYSVSDSGLQNQEHSTRHFDLNQTTPANGPINTASQIIFSEDQQNVVVAVKGNPPSRGYLAVWPLGVDDERRPAADFVRIPAPAPGGLPFSLIQIPGKNALLSADFAVGVDVWDFTQGVDRVNGSDRTTALTIPGQITACWSAYSSQTGNFYIADPATDIITEINVNDDLAPSLVSNYTIFAGGANIDTAVATVNGQDYLYTLLTNAVGVGIMKLNGPGDAQVSALVDYSVPVGNDNITITRNFMQGMAIYLKPN